MQDVTYVNVSESTDTKYSTMSCQLLYRLCIGYLYSCSCTKSPSETVQWGSFVLFLLTHENLMSLSMWQQQDINLILGINIKKSFHDNKWWTRNIWPTIQITASTMMISAPFRTIQKKKKRKQQQSPKRSHSYCVCAIFCLFLFYCWQFTAI